MARSTGLAPRRAYELDALTVLVGAVKAGTKGRAAATRTGAAQVLTTDLAKYDVIKFVGFGQTSTAAGGYIIEVADVPEATGVIGTYAPVATVTVSGIATTEVAVSGKQIADLVGAANSGGTRCVAVRATAGTGGGGNGVVVPAGTMTICVQPVG
jgi:hypothetical protein